MWAARPRASPPRLRAPPRTRTRRAGARLPCRRSTGGGGPVRGRHGCVRVAPRSATSSRSRSPSSKRSRSPSTRASCVSASTAKGVEARPVASRSSKSQSGRSGSLIGPWWRSAGSRRTRRPTSSRPTRTRARARRRARPCPCGTRLRSRIGAAGGRRDGRAADVGVLDRVDVDRLAVGVHRPARRAADEAAVEAGRVVGGHRSVVVAAVGRDRPEPPDREARGPEPAEDGRRRRGATRRATTIAPDVRLAVEAPVRDVRPSAAAPAPTGQPAR